MSGELMLPTHETPYAEGCLRKMFHLSFGKLYVTTGATFMEATVPFENREEKRSLRQLVDRVCENAPHKDWQGVSRYRTDAWGIVGEYPSYVEEELIEVIHCLSLAAEEFYIEKLAALNI